MEVVVPKTASYSDLLKLWASALKIEEESDYGPLTLFRCDGTVIPSDPLRGSDGTSQPWTVNNYLCLIRKSAALVKFCVGYSVLVRHTNEYPLVHVFGCYSTILHFVLY